ncbi:hypothetical protein CHL76_14445 [Marinococcus halophilus]|nr:hypothetical protein [Marinococcus halophilus]OZT79151.1 hypothetical protein CHL76_14445 [Marinococcus halophilus]
MFLIIHISKMNTASPQAARDGRAAIEDLEDTRKMFNPKTLHRHLQGAGFHVRKSDVVSGRLILKYFHLVTALPKIVISSIETGLHEESLHPEAAKIQLARTVVAMYHNEQQAE